MPKKDAGKAGRGKGATRKVLSKSEQKKVKGGLVAETPTLSNKLSDSINLSKKLNSPGEW